MFDKIGLKKYIETLNLIENEYCIIAGASLLLHDIKEYTDDLDLCVSEKQLKKLKETYLVKKSEKPYPNLYEVDEKLEVVVCDLTEKSIYHIDGYPCTSVQNEYNWKKEHNRPKDQEIISKIEQLFKVIAERYRCSEEELSEKMIEEYIQKYGGKYETSNNI